MSTRCPRLAFPGLLAAVLLVPPMAVTLALLASEDPKHFAVGKRLALDWTTEYP